MVLIDSPNIFRPIHDGRSRFEAALVFLLDGNMPSIDLHNQVSGRRRTCLGCRGETVLLRQHAPYVIRHPFDLRMIIHAPRLTIQLPQVAHRLTVAIQGPLFTVQFR